MSSDALQIAIQRQKEYAKTIAAKETEIAEMKELIADLESFIEFGESLIGKPTKNVDEIARPAAQKKQEQPADPADEWASDDAQINHKSINRVLSSRTSQV